MQISNSGPITTSGTTAVKVISGQPGVLMRQASFFNPTSSGAGSLSFDGGSTWTLDFPAGLYSLTLPAGYYANDIYVKRSGSTDVSGFELALIAAAGAV